MSLSRWKLNKMPFRLQSKTIIHLFFFDRFHIQNTGQSTASAWPLLWWGRIGSPSNLFMVGGICPCRLSCRCHPSLQVAPLWTNRTSMHGFKYFAVVVFCVVWICFTYCSLRHGQDQASIHHLLKITMDVDKLIQQLFFNISLAK